MPSTPEVGLALSGGNALGAYAAGAYEALHEQGVRLDVISGASVGAITAALIAGSPPALRLQRLREFWAQASTGGWPWLGLPGWPRAAYNAWHTWQTFVLGRPGLFRPGAGWPTLLSSWPGGASAPAMFDTGPLLQTLQRLVDFEFLHRDGPRVVVCAVDLETGEPVYVDSRQQRITPELLGASTGLVPCFRPVEVDGRLLADPGLVCNLPLDPLLAPSPRDRVCIAVDLFTAAGLRPRTLNDAAERAQDIAFSAQSSRTLQAFRREQRLRHALQQAGQALGGDQAVAEEPVGRVDVLLVEHHSPPHDGGGKTFEYSPASVQERWAAGRADMVQALHRLETSEPDEDDLGFALYRVPR